MALIENNMTSDLTPNECLEKMIGTAVLDEGVSAPRAGDVLELECVANAIQDTTSNDCDMECQARNEGCYIPAEKPIENCPKKSKQDLVQFLSPSPELPPDCCAHIIEHKKTNIDDCCSHAECEGYPSCGCPTKNLTPRCHTPVSLLITEESSECCDFNEHKIDYLDDCPNESSMPVCSDCVKFCDKGNDCQAIIMINEPGRFVDPCKEETLPEICDALVNFKETSI